MESPLESQGDASPPRYGFDLPPDKLLPAICPVCGAPGTRPHRVHETGPVYAQRDNNLKPLDAFYCDLCADEKNSLKTRSIALFAACALFAISVATAAALAWGARALSLQIVITLLAGALPALTLSWQSAWPLRKDSVWLEASPARSSLWCRTRSFRRALVEHGFAEVPQTVPEFQSKDLRLPYRRAASLCLVGVAWLGLLHSLGGATVRVLVSGKERAVLLVDGRHAGYIDPTNDEDPQAGISARVLGGRRKLELYSIAGEILSQQTTTIWPGRTYIVGHLAAGDCFFWERRTYGEQSRPSVFFPVSGNGPVWELRDPVDSWFTPLQAPGAKDAESGDDWKLSGGVRRALRLRRCRPGLAP